MVMGMRLCSHWWAFVHSLMSICTFVHLGLEHLYVCAFVLLALEHLSFWAFEHLSICSFVHLAIEHLIICPFEHFCISNLSIWAFEHLALAVGTVCQHLAAVGILQLCFLTFDVCHMMKCKANPAFGHLSISHWCVRACELVHLSSLCSCATHLCICAQQWQWHWHWTLACEFKRRGNDFGHPTAKRCSGKEEEGTSDAATCQTKAVAPTNDWAKLSRQRVFCGEFCELRYLTPLLCFEPWTRYASLINPQHLAFGDDEFDPTTCVPANWLCDQSLPLAVNILFIPPSTQTSSMCIFTETETAQPSLFCACQNLLPVDFLCFRMRFPR